jgi:Flp pilus assembly protein TadG
MDINGERTTWGARRHKGIATVEFALIAPLLMLVLAATLDFAMLLRTAACVADAARTGAQYGSQSTLKSLDTAGMQAAALNASPGIAGMTTSVVRSCQCWCGGSVGCGGTCPGNPMMVYVKVTSRATAHTIFNYSRLSFSGVVESTASMRAQ